MSGMSDVEVQGQIAHMIAFIDQEASEKVEEIDAKAEEEFNLEKGRLVQQGRVKVMEYYDKKEKGIEQNMKIQHSNLLNASRLAILKKKQELLEEFEEQSREQTIKDLESDPAKYRQVMISMTVQGLVRLMESRVLVQVRPQDVKLMESITKECQDQYATFMNNEIKRRKQDFSVVITLSEDRLPADLIGGVILLTEDEKISCNNTMDARLKDIFKQNQPQIRETLFGSNPNRRFRD